MAGSALRAPSANGYAEAARADRYEARRARRVAARRRVARNRLLAALFVAVLITGSAWRIDSASHPMPFVSSDEAAYARLAHGMSATGEYRALGVSPEKVSVNATAFGKSPFHWPPGAPWLFSVGQDLWPEPLVPERPDVPGAYFFQGLVSILLIPVVFALGVVLRGPGTGVAAAAVAAFYPPLADGPSDLLSEPLGTLLLTSAVLALAVGLKRPRLLAFVVSGALLGATALTHADLAILVPVLAVVVGALLVARVGVRKAALSGSVLALAAIMVVLPWSIHASGQVGSFTPLTVGGAPAFWVGSFLPGNGSLWGLKRACETGDPELRFVPDRERMRPPARGASRPCEPIGAVIDGVARLHPELSPADALGLETSRNVQRYAFGRPFAFLDMVGDKAERMWFDYTRGGGRRVVPAVETMHLIVVWVALAGLIAGLARAGRRPLVILVLAAVLTPTALHAYATAMPRYAVVLLPVALAGGLAGLPSRSSIAALASRARHEPAEPRIA